MGNDQDLALIEDCRKGDRRALGSLVRRYERPVYNAAYRMLGTADEAADVAQTTFLKAFENLHRYNPQYKFFSWIYRIAVNESINQLNRRKRFEQGFRAFQKLAALPAVDTMNEHGLSSLAQRAPSIRTQLGRAEIVTD